MNRGRFTHGLGVARAPGKVRASKQKRIFASYSRQALFPGLNPGNPFFLAFVLLVGFDGLRLRSFESGQNARPDPVTP